MAMAFPANLARRFTSTVGLLRSRSGPKGVSGAKRSISDELVAMVKGEQAVLHCRDAQRGADTWLSKA